MRRELITKSKAMAGTSDLTLLAPIRPGLVSSLESVTYKTRIKRLLQALNGGRTSSQEYALLRPFSDAVERVGRIHSVRVTVVEPENKVLLAVTFDGTWENYIRVLWQKVGTLMDIIFFDTEGYASAYDQRFEEWEAWARSVQIETHFFYGTPFLTVDDVQYLKQEEALHRGCPMAVSTDVAATRHRVSSAEALAWKGAAKTSGQTSLETFKQGLEALAALYRLTDLYLPGSEDGYFLQRAVRDLLREFVELLDHDEIPLTLVQAARMRFDKQLAWLRGDMPLPKNPQRVAPPLPTSYPEFDEADVQGGIVTGFEGITHGCLMLLAIEDRGRALPFFEAVVNAVRLEKDPKLGDKECALTASLSYEGLRAAGMSEDELALFPQEFREGMELRSSVLGDMRTNHPRRWRLPERHGAKPDDGLPERIELTAVHLVLQLRGVGSKDNVWHALDDKHNPVKPEFEKWRDLAGQHGMRLLAVQPLRRYFQNRESTQIVEHFGFADGNSDPVIDPKKAGQRYPNQVQLGELLIGYGNEADWPADPEHRKDPAAERLRLGWLRNGSYLVLRKLAQFPERLEQLVAEAVDTAQKQGVSISPEELRARMMGRWDNGTPLIKRGTNLDETIGPQDNDFDYADDPAGLMCPFHSHVRRVNPRITALEVNEPLGRRTPRIARRGMSYGPRMKDGPADAERGMVFMAYNTSIAEQFEVVQRWLAGGNSSGGFSGQSDPFVGVPENGRRRAFRFEHTPAASEAGSSQVVSIALDGSDDALGERDPIVRLDWGAYLFTPSMTMLRRLRDRLSQSFAAPEAVWSAVEGEQLIRSLFDKECELDPKAAMEAWKTAIEDPIEQEKFRAASIWAAIREHHGGVLRTAYGLLVADGDLAKQVLSSPQTYSVRGYHERLATSIGDIYLGQDANGGYEKLSKETNDAIAALDEAKEYERTRNLTREVLREFLFAAQQAPNPAVPQQWELILEIKEVVDQVLGRLCWWWFGLPKDGCDELRLSGQRWDADPRQALYPGHFTAPSRYVFQPWPGDSAEQYGRDYGKTLTSAFIRFVQRTIADNAWPLQDPDRQVAPITEAIWKAFGGKDPQPELMARTLVGSMMGMLPTVDGNLRRSLNEWLYDGSFWSLRAAWTEREKTSNPGLEFEQALAILRPPLVRSMQLRPSPELVWRTAIADAALGPETVAYGDRVVVSIVSASQQCLADGNPDVSLVFGGNRRLHDHPTHACPGYRAAMGVLLGFIAGLLDTPEAMRASAVPLALTFDGPFADPAQNQEAEPKPKAEPRRSAMLPPIEEGPAKLNRDRLDALLHEARKSKKLERATVPETPTTPSTSPIVGLGDSWFHYFALDVFDVFEEECGFKVNSLALEGASLQSIHADPAQLLRLDEELERSVRRNQPIQAVLLSAGGNDVVRDALESILEPADPEHPERVRWKEEQRDILINVTMQDALHEILSGIIELCDWRLGHDSTPVLLHGYDHPFPDGRGLVSTPWESWLKPAFDSKGYGFPAGREAMRELIAQLNRMQLSVIDKFNNRVIHVDLQGKLGATDGNYQQFWSNELHPTAEGFIALARILASEIRRAIDGARPAPPPDALPN